MPFVAYYTIIIALLDLLSKFWTTAVKVNTL